MKYHLIHFTLGLTLVLLIAVGWHQCSNVPARLPQPCFYYWKTEMHFDSAEWKHFERLSGAQPLYLRVFDVDYSAGYANAVPLGDLDLEGITNVSDGRPIIPTVYITNRVFEQLDKAQIDVLAGKIHRRIKNRLESWKNGVTWKMLPPEERKNTHNVSEKRLDSLRNVWVSRCNEIQIDCDWTARTRDKYFQFLRTFRSYAAPRRISCTVRLHQYRDRINMGIPPVDRGMLMCYNVSDAKNVATSNAVFDVSLIKGYLKAPHYPIPLDMALPVFSWGAWFREDKFQGLLNGWNEEMASDQHLYQKESPGRYRVLQDTVIGKDYFRTGDLVRLDQPSDAALLEIAELLRTIRGRDARLVFFDWQTEKIDRYEKVITACAARFE